jgi:hypothetical protein
MFIVGKKYKYRSSIGTYVCIGIHGGWAWMEFEGGGKAPISTKISTSNEYWAEYIPPIRKMMRAVLSERKDNLVVISESGYKSDLEEHIAFVEFTYDIHYGLRAEIINGIG